MSSNVRTEPFTVDVDGATIAPVETPETVEALSEIVRQVARDRLRALLVGNGTRLAFGNRGGPFDVAISTARLNRVIQYEPDDLTLAVEPGCTLRQLRELLGAQGQQVTLDAAHPERATIGGSFATGLSSPRRLGGGALKDWTIGIEVVGPDGALAKAGGMVVKNVTGFDMMHVHYGALGALGVVTRLNLKVFPKPDAERSIAVRYERVGDAYAAGVALLASQLQLSALTIDNENGWRVRVRLDAPATVIEQLAQRVLSVAAASVPLDDTTVSHDGRQALAAFEHVVDLLSGRAVARVSLPTSKQLPALKALAGLKGMAACADLGSGLLYLAAAPSTVMLAAAGPHAAWLALPGELKTGRDVFGAVDERSLPVVRRLKAAFDPAGRLNTGRWVAGL